MALLISVLRHNYSRQIQRSLLCVKCPVCFESPNCISNACEETTANKTDPLDDFTIKLVQEKSEKWKSLNTMNIKQSERKLLPHDKFNNSFNSSDIDFIAISELIRKAIDSKLHQVILSLLNICETKKICPSSELLQEIASIFSRQGSKIGLEAVQSVCKINNQNEYVIQAEFKHYLAEVTWVNGNVEDAIGIFEEVYKNYPPLRRKIRNMTKYLIAECVCNRSEASVVLVTNSAKKYATKYKDFYFLACLWQYLFLSEWFADQKAANDLCEDYSELRTIISERLQYLAAIAIRKHDTDVIQRLFEVTLHYNMMKEYTHILRSFFDYKCSIGDLKSCKEIMASALDENVTLTCEQHSKFLVLLLTSNNSGTSWLSRRKNSEYLQRQLKVPPFQMKF